MNSILKAVPHGQRVAEIVPGLFLALVVTIAALALQSVPVLSGAGPMILAVLLGIAYRSLLKVPETAVAGLAFCARVVLRGAIVLLGLRITLGQIAAVDVSGLMIVVVSLAATFLFTLWLARAAGIDAGQGGLLAAGVSICGASAVLAANTVTRSPDADVSYAIASVTLLGTLAMAVYPVLAGMLGLDPHSYGVWAGASLHEVAQVVAAGFHFGPESGEVATVVKLTRVLCLVPVILLWGFAANRAMARKGGAGPKVPVPWFIFGFAAMVALNTIVPVPAEVASGVASVTSFLLTLSLAAMGLQTDPGVLRNRGWRPLGVGLAASVFLSVFSLVLVLALPK